MDYGDYVVDESTALASSQQTVESRGSSGESWNEISANRGGCDVFELFEVHRRSANRYLNQYFDCLAGLPTSITELNESDMSQELSKRDGSETERNMWLLKVSHDSAVRDLRVLVEILDKIKEQDKPRKTNVPPILAAWTFTCSVLAMAVPHRVSSSIFKIGALAGALLFTVRLLRKAPSIQIIDPVQHKIQWLLRSFEEGTMRYRDRSEVLISALDHTRGH